MHGSVCQRANEFASHVGEIEASVEAPSGFTEVSVGVFAELEGVIAAVNGAFDVAKYGVDPDRSRCDACRSASFGHHQGSRMAALFKGV